MVLSCRYVPRRLETYWRDVTVTRHGAWGARRRLGRNLSWKATVGSEFAHQANPSQLSYGRRRVRQACHFCTKHRAAETSAPGSWHFPKCWSSAKTAAAIAKPI